MKEVYKIGATTIYCDIFKVIDARMYILVHLEKAIIVDPFESLDVAEMLGRMGIKNVLIILTHEHIDHISGVNFFRDKFDTEVLASKICARCIMDAKTNLAKYFNLLVDISGGDINLLDDFDLEYTCTADQTFESEYVFNWQGHQINLTETPGHSKGSICITIDDKIVFTGDSLVNGHPVITKLSGGSKKAYLAKTKPFLLSLSPTIIVMPGHGEIEKLDKLYEFMEFA